MNRNTLLFVCCLLANLAFGQQSKLHPHTKILFFGDSHTAYGFGERANSVQYQNHGYVAWVNALCPDVQIPKGGILAVPGETTVHMQKRLSAIAGFGAKTLVVLAGTNDILYPVNPDTTKANLRRIYNTGLAAGMRVIAITILPQFTTSGYYDIIEGFRHNVNNWIRSQTDVTVIDADHDLNNAALYEDQIHLKPQGALLLGRKVAEVVNALTLHCLPASGTAAQLSVAGNDNPFLTGTNGLKTRATGTVANNWELTATLGSGASVNGSKEANGQGKEKQVITISGTYTGTGHNVALSHHASLPVSLQAGNDIEAIAELEIPTSMVGIKTIYLKVTANNADYRLVLAEGNSLFNTSAHPVSFPPGHYLLRTPPVTIGSGGVISELITQVVVEFNNTQATAPVSATLRFGSIGIRRLPLNNGPLPAIQRSGPLTVCPGQPATLTTGNDNGLAIQWLRNAEVLAGQTTESLSVTAGGSYSVKVSSQSCTVLSEAVIIEECPVAITLNKWTGAVSTAWENPRNWSLNRVPDEATKVIIESGNVVVDSQATCRSLTTGAGARLTVKTGKQLRVWQ